jgi:hypothetical protein
VGDVLQRHLGGVDTLDPGQWTNEGVAGFVEAKAVVKCADCGGIDVIAEGHEVSPDGRVVPVWRCPTVTCGARKWIWLEGYSR